MFIRDAGGWLSIQSPNSDFSFSSACRGQILSLPSPSYISIGIESAILHQYSLWSLAGLGEVIVPFWSKSEGSIATRDQLTLHNI